jgi:hypothetical protein
MGWSSDQISRVHGGAIFSAKSGDAVLRAFLILHVSQSAIDHFRLCNFKNLSVFAATLFTLTLSIIYRIEVRLSILLLLANPCLVSGRGDNKLQPQALYARRLIAAWNTRSNADVLLLSCSRCVICPASA